MVLLRRRSPKFKTLVPLLGVYLFFHMNHCVNANEEQKVIPNYTPPIDIVLPGSENAAKECASPYYPPRVIPMPEAQHHNKSFIHWIDFGSPINKGRRAYLVKTNLPWSVIVPPQKASTDKTTAITNPGNRKQKNNRLWNTLHQAKHNHCIMATNGGPYNADGTSSGPLVLQGHVVKSATTDYVGFGTTQSKSAGNGFTTCNNNTGNWLIGKYHDFPPEIISNMYNFVTGFGWLVYNGKAVANNTQNPTRAERAARTTVGLDRENNLFFLVVDGCEKCRREKGLTLEELAQLSVSLGARFAINMDGGGSTTLVNASSVVNKPTCLDIPLYCQRPVATVMCIKDVDPIIENIKLDA